MENMTADPGFNPNMVIIVQNVIYDGVELNSVCKLSWICLVRRDMPSHQLIDVQL